MAIFIYKFYNEKTEANKKLAEVQTQVNNLNETASNLQGKIDEVTTTIDSNNTTKNATTINQKEDTSIITLDKKYENSKYGINFLYPSLLSDHQNSLTNDMVESFSDNNGNEIVIARFNNDTVESMIDFEKNKVMPDGTKVNVDIKKEGYVTLNSGTKGYSIETNHNNIIFITEKNNITFRFTITYTTGNEAVCTNILNSFSLK
ncbi:MAG: hypothetical protein HFJ34_06800 [Clostridia bacterium]|nr:hypothetical protein [Clostridia bacterium]